LALPQEKKKGFSGVKQLRGHQAIPHHPMKAIFIGIRCSYVWFNNLQEKLRSFFNYQLAPKNCIIFAIHPRMKMMKPWQEDVLGH